LSSAVIAISDRLVYSNGIILLSLCCCFSRYLPGQVNAIILRSGCIYFIYPVPSWDGTPLVQTADIGWQASALMNGLGSHCYSSRSGSSRDDEVPRRSLVGRGGNSFSEPICIRRHYEYVAERLSIQGYRLEVMFPDLKQVVTHPAVVVIASREP